MSERFEASYLCGGIMLSYSFDTLCPHFMRLASKPRFWVKKRNLTQSQPETSNRNRSKET